MAGSKSTQTGFVRDNRIYYSIPMLAFLDYYAPINVDVFVECGMWETFRLFPNCHDGSGQSVVIQWLFFAPLKKQAQGCIVDAIIPYKSQGENQVLSLNWLLC